MAHRSLALALLLGVAGCAGADEGAAAAAARRFVETAGTPLYAVAKGAACVVAAAGSLPAAALANAAPGLEPGEKGELDGDIYPTGGRACGGGHTPPQTPPPRARGAPPPPPPPRGGGKKRRVAA